MWTKPEEKDFLISNLKPTDHMLEYGCGYSTLELPKYVKSMISIEHHREWFNKIVNDVALPQNSLVKYVPNNLQWDSVDGTLEEFYSYINTPLSFGPYDVIFIDGRARVECARMALNMLNNGGRIFIHDFGPKMIQDDGTSRTHYNVVLDFLTIVDSVETMFMFKPKET